MSRMDKKDPSDERKEKSSIHEETVCCEDGACNWHDNTLAQSEGDKGGGYRDKAV